MEGQGWHYSSSDKRLMPGHSLFQSVYCLLGRQLPLTPHLYRQRAVREREGVPFQSKIDLAVHEIETFSPPPDTHTHVLADSWYVAKRVWQAVRQRSWDFTGRLKSNRQLRIALADGQRLWLRVDQWAAGLTPPAMTTPKPHEIHKQVSDLLAREELEQAPQWDGSAQPSALPHHHG